MTNCGKFDLHVDWELKSQPVPVTPPVPAGKAVKPKAASAAAKDAAALAAAAPVFLFEPKVQLMASVQPASCVAIAPFNSFGFITTEHCIKQLPSQSAVCHMLVFPELRSKLANLVVGVIVAEPVGHEYGDPAALPGHMRSAGVCMLDVGNGLESG
jgi:hypothetical protein